MSFQEVALDVLIEPAPLERSGNRDLPILSMTMHEGLVDQGAKFKKRVASANTADYKLVRRNQLVVGFPIDEGVLSFQNLYDEAIVSPAYDTWRLRADIEVEPAYLERFLRAPRALAFYRAKLRGTTARRRTLPDDIFLRLAVPLPPLPEQRRIAEILDKADTLRAKRRAALAQLDILTQSIFLDMFGDPAANPKGWPYSRLGDVTDFYAGSTLPSGDAFDGQADGYFLLKVSDMNLAGNEVYLESCQQWSAEPGAASSTCPAASIVIPKRGGAIGTNKKRIAVRPSVLDPNLMAIWPRPDLIELSFLYSWLLRLDLASITSGSSVPQLNKRDLDPLSIPVPPLEAQREFSHKFGAMEGVIMFHDRALSVCDTLCAALQHGAFQGEL